MMTALALSLLSTKVDAHYCSEWFGDPEQRKEGGKMVFQKTADGKMIFPTEGRKSRPLSCSLAGVEAPSASGPGQQLHRSITTQLIPPPVDDPNECKAWFAQMVPMGQAYLGIVLTSSSVDKYATLTCSLH